MYWKNKKPYTKPKSTKRSLSSSWREGKSKSSWRIIWILWSSSQIWRKELPVRTPRHRSWRFLQTSRRLTHETVSPPSHNSKSSNQIGPQMESWIIRPSKSYSRESLVNRRTRRWTHTRSRSKSFTSQKCQRRRHLSLSNSARIWRPKQRKPSHMRTI